MGIRSILVSCFSSGLQIVEARNSDCVFPALLMQKYYRSMRHYAYSDHVWPWADIHTSGNWNALSSINQNNLLSLEFSSSSRLRYIHISN